MMVCPRCKKKVTSTVFKKGEWLCYECANYVSYDFGGNMPVAIYKDKKGNDIAVNKKGNIVENPYKKNDPRGWESAGYGRQGYERTVLFK